MFYNNVLSSLQYQSLQKCWLQKRRDVEDLSSVTHTWNLTGGHLPYAHTSKQLISVRPSPTFN